MGSDKKETSARHGAKHRLKVISKPKMFKAQIEAKDFFTRRQFLRGKFFLGFEL